MHEQIVATAAKMCECRTAARSILGDKYQDRMRELAQVVMAVAERDQCNPIVAGATVIKTAGLEGMQSLMLMAAVVEMVEPSNADVTGLAPTKEEK